MSITPNTEWTHDDWVAAVDRILDRWIVVDVGGGEIIIADAEDVVVDAGDGQVAGIRWVLAAGPADSFRSAAEELLRDVAECQLSEEESH